jgi:DNA-binding response OmpR family regulator
MVPGTLKKKHILIVDDDVCLCELLTLYFRHKGLAVSTARNAQKAIDLVWHTTLDLVITDWNLDGTSALDLMIFCRGKCPEVPVVVFTGMAVDRRFLDLVLRSRADAVVHKNGSLHQLCATVFRLLGAPRPPNN